MDNTFFKSLAFIAAVTCLTAAPSSCPADSEYNQELCEEAREWLEGELALEDGETAEITITSAPRRDYPVCEGPVEFSVAAGKVRKNNSIKTECKSDTTPWHFYLTARVVIKTPFVTVISAVPKNSMLSRDNLTIAYMDKVLNRGTTFSDPALLDGIRTKRDLKPGQPVHSNQICVICQGDEIDIEAAGGSFSIRTRGEAMQDGSYGDFIRVKNLKSGKTVKARVIDSSLTRIDM